MRASFVGSILDSATGFKVPEQFGAGACAAGPAAAAAASASVVVPVAAQRGQCSNYGKLTEDV